MGEDLILGKPEGDNIEEVGDEEEYEVAYTTLSEAIHGANAAISAICDMDTALMTKQDEKRIYRIKRKSLRIIDKCISDIYQEIFEEIENNEDEN